MSEIAMKFMNYCWKEEAKHHPKHPSACSQHRAPYLAALHVLHVEAILALLPFLVLLLLAAAFFDYAEAAGEDEQRSHHSDGNQSPRRHCENNGELRSTFVHLVR